MKITKGKRKSELPLGISSPKSAQNNKVFTGKEHSGFGF